ncbi:type I 3-dehydroquinate dehydratase [Pseudobutyrivibrio sp.]|uniref:type I 3-dehydroquinate dehydratase n=1 Tax=Pseudobutyrivibrio sp. TaxID=2014367 RepID=UPI001D1AF5C9|nr:type I 3-dehydroquinate dehydratase [Pseudobutyrivibrio sp.]MBE5910180.1 type I 3-dehydroquinate dehydratase [Pseudobutyrivibrio sp.]
MSKELIIKNHRLSSDKVKVCIPVLASTFESAIELVEKCVKNGVPIIELRADYFDFLNQKDVLEAFLQKTAERTKNTVVLFTIRTDVEGGEYSFDEDLYKDILLSVSHTGTVDIIDIEATHIQNATHFINQLQDNGVYVLASHHNFNETPELLDMLDIFDSLQETGADILKIAVMPKDFDDVIRTLKAANIANEDCDSLIIMISMGEIGKVSRIIGSSVGSCMTFASLEKASAPGQLDYEDLNTILNILG